MAGARGTGVARCCADCRAVVMRENMRPADAEARRHERVGGFGRWVAGIGGLIVEHERDLAFVLVDFVLGLPDQNAFAMARMSDNVAESADSGPIDRTQDTTADTGARTPARRTRATACFSRLLMLLGVK